MNIPRNIAASMYNAWFRKEYPELFECEIKETAESCEDCGFCNEKEENNGTTDEDTGYTTEDIYAMKKELCQYCGKYKHAHEGACDGCKWREM